MRKIISLALMILLTVELAHIAFASAARAEMPEPTPEPQKPVYMAMAPTPTVTPMDRPQPVIYDYHTGKDHLEAVARGFWGLNTEAEKRGFAFVVVNRTYSNQLRADGTREWADSIKGNVEQPGEFSFYEPDAPVSKENYKLAELYINAQTTYILTKSYTGYPFPSTMLFMAWDGESLAFMTERGGTPWYYGD